MISEFLRQNVKKRRKELGLTQAEACELAGISHRYWAGLELGQGWPSPEFLGKIASALNVPITDLLRNPNEQIPTVIHSPTLLDAIKLLEAYQGATETSRIEALRKLEV